MADFESLLLQSLRRLRTGARDVLGLTVSYLNPQGEPIAWTGDDDAPYVKAVTVPAGGSTTLDWIQSGATPASSLVVKASSGLIYQVYFYNNSGSTRYLQLFNAAAAPALASVPVIPALPVPAGEYADIDFGVFPMELTTGIVLGCSSTALTYTAAADGVFTALYL